MHVKIKSLLMKNNSTMALPNQINKVFFDFQLSSSLEHFIRCSCDAADKPRLTIEVFCRTSARQGDRGGLSQPPRAQPGDNCSKHAGQSDSGSPSLRHGRGRAPPLLAGLLLGPSHPRHPREHCHNTSTTTAKPGDVGTASSEASAAPPCPDSRDG